MQITTLGEVTFGDADGRGDLGCGVLEIPVREPVGCLLPANFDKLELNSIGSTDDELGWWLTGRAAGGFTRVLFESLQETL